MKADAGHERGAQRVHPTIATREVAARVREPVFIGAFAAIAAFFLFTEHRAHLFGVLPYRLLLACPLMHLFHHGGHGGHGGKAEDKEERK